MPKGGGKADQRQLRKKALLALLRDVRKEAGLRQADLAKKLEKPQSYVSKYDAVQDPANFGPLARFDQQVVSAAPDHL